MSIFGLIEYSDASPYVRAVYDDIMATRKRLDETISGKRSRTIFFRGGFWGWGWGGWGVGKNAQAYLARYQADRGPFALPRESSLTKALIYVAVR